MGYLLPVNLPLGIVPLIEPEADTQYAPSTSLQAVSRNQIEAPAEKHPENETTCCVLRAMKIYFSMQAFQAFPSGKQRSLHDGFAKNSGERGIQNEDQNDRTLRN